MTLIGKMADRYHILEQLVLDGRATSTKPATRAWRIISAEISLAYKALNCIQGRVEMASVTGSVRIT